jgi:adenosine/AMP kinase
MMEAVITVVPLSWKDGANIVVGQSHFIKTVEDIHEAMAMFAPQMRFGIAFSESSGPALVRRSGNDDGLIEIATSNALAVGAGHSFFVFMDGGFPVNVLNAIKTVPEVCRIYCATANPVEVVLAETEQGRAILGVVDGCSPKGVESSEDVRGRIGLLRKIGYKLG